MSAKHPPDRLCTQKGTRFYNKDCAHIRISIDGVEQHDTVLEYCVSAGWARCHVVINGIKQPGALGPGSWRTRMVHGRVVVWWSHATAPMGALNG
jgi:hypothetical protein